MEKKKTAVALGLFDGVHLGHREVLKTAYSQRENGLIPGVFTFVPESAAYKSDSAYGYIYGLRHKLDLIGECGIVRMEVLPFRLVQGMSGEEFVQRVLRDRMNAAFVCCGRDFRFGRGASCGVDELMDLGRTYGFQVQVVDDVKSGDLTVSSTTIRIMLTEGDVQGANALLGKSYTISGTVVDGNHIGRTIDFPTINQNFSEGQLVPHYGVYSGSVCVDGEVYRTVTNIGVKPTIEGQRLPLAETHILGYSGNLYGRKLCVHLGDFIRGEQRFGSLDELRAQIKRDIMAADI